MNKVYLLTGGNLGNRKENLEMAKNLTGRCCGQVTRASPVFETAAWGMTDQPAFLNQVLELETKCAAEDLMQQLLKVEAAMGRQRGEKYGPRIIDIDILLFNFEVIHSPTLQVPHPALPRRRFALAPLASLVPEYIHPVLGKPIRQLLAECPDSLPVKKI